VTLSRQFRALVKLAALLAIPWAAFGAALAAFRWLTVPEIRSTAGSFGGWIFGSIVGYGSLGLISGLALGLLLARLKRGRRIEEVSARRMVLWGTLGAAVPSLVLGGFVTLVGGWTVVYVSVVGLAVASVAIGGVLTRSTLTKATDRLPADPADMGRLRT
jgi:hypothetical protein